MFKLLTASVASSHVMCHPSKKNRSYVAVLSNVPRLLFVFVFPL